MVLVRTLRKHNANIVVEAHGEILFTPTAPFGRLASRFADRVLGFAEGYAPINKRPRWAHYGKPLKSTFYARTKYDPARMKVHSAIGSSAPHAYYVDQGTGVFAGSGPYEAKILPPWSRGDASLYEHTWRPGGGPGSRRVAPVMIKGQRGQFFFDKALKRAFESMRMRSFQVPGEGKISKALDSVATGLEGFAGNTAATGAFIPQLKQWREWRDAAYARGQSLNRTRYDSAAALARHNAASARLAAAHRSAAMARLRRAAADLAASKAAARERKREQEEKLLEQRRRIEAGRRKREAEDKKRKAEMALRSGNEQMRRQALKFYNVIKKAHPEATLRSTTLADGVVLYRVSYTLNGETVRQQWAWGYNTD